MDYKKVPGVMTVIFVLLFIFSATCPRMSQAALVLSPELEDIRTMIDEGWWEEAELELKKMLEASPKDPSVAYLLSHLYARELEQNLDIHWDDVEDLSRETLKNDEDNVHYLINYGNIMGLKARNGSKIAGMGRVKKSLRAFERVLELDPDNIEARDWLMGFHIYAPGIAGGNKDRARELAVEIAGIDLARGRNALAMVYENIDKDPGKAEKELLAAIDDDAGNPLPHYRYISFLRRNERFEEAESLLEKVKEVDDTVDPDFNLAGLYRQMERFDEAEKIYQKYAAFDTTRVRALDNLGFLYQGLERWDEAIETFEKILEADPDKRDALYQIGRTCLFSKSRYDKAEAAFTQYIDGKVNAYWPSRAWAYYRLALVYKEQNKRKNVKAALKQALRLDPGHKEAKKLKSRYNR